MAILVVASLACARGSLPLPTTQTAPDPEQGSPTEVADPIATVALVEDPASTPIPAPLPTLAFDPAWSALPTQAYDPASTLMYPAQSGDTLLALALRFSVGMDEITSPQPLDTAGLLNPGQWLFIPRRIEAASPSTRLIPDSELVFSTNASGLDLPGYVRQRGGYLDGYRGYVAGKTIAGAQIVERVALEHSVNPRLLLGLIEYYSGWVSQPAPDPATLIFPMQYPSERDRGLYHQLSWAADKLNVGYYGWRIGRLTELTFTDGSRQRIAPEQNAGTVALQYFFSLNRTREEWERAVAPEGFLRLYTAMFGNPADRAVDPLLPTGLTQPALELPFLPGRKWSYTGGPHGAWEREGAVAAIDFGPPSVEHGCVESDEWVTASAPGLVVRAEDGVLMLDLDGDGREQTGWVLFYMHIAEKGRVKVGQFVESGDLLGHPSCEGGWATGTHLHFARKYNGEWILADGPIPFALSGWVARSGQRPYYGYLEKDGVSIASCTCGSPNTWIWR